MNFFHSLQIALDNLRANKLRSLLTMLGIIIGVSAVIMMVAILQGASSHITKEFEKFGSNLIIVGYAPNEEERKTQTRHLEGLKNEDVAAIRDQCGLIRGLSPEMPMGSPKLKYAGRDMDASGTGVCRTTNVCGMSRWYTDVLSLTTTSAPGPKSA